MSKALAISHVGIAVADLERAVEQYELLLGRKPSLITTVEDQQVKVAIFDSPDDQVDANGNRIELLAPTNAGSPVQRFLNKRGEGLHHVCLYVEDIDRALKELRAAGIRLIDESPRVGAEGARIAFVHPENMHGVLIELEERKVQVGG